MGIEEEVCMWRYGRMGWGRSRILLWGVQVLLGVYHKFVISLKNVSEFRPFTVVLMNPWNQPLPLPDLPLIGVLI